jgi:pilus assembly protein Flp/PilA
MNDLRAVRRALAACVAQPLRYEGPWRGSDRAIVNRGHAATSAPYENGAHNIREDLMSQLVAFVKSFSRNEEGQDLLEYALLVALIALIAIGAVGAAGGAVNGIFTAIAGALGGAA